MNQPLGVRQLRGSYWNIVFHKFQYLPDKSSNYGNPEELCVK